MKRYYIVCSTSPWLLARLCTDLQMCGYKLSKMCIRHESHPFGAWDKLTVNHPEQKGLCFWITDIQNYSPCRLWITERNYTEFLTMITNNK